MYGTLKLFQFFIMSKKIKEILWEKRKVFIILFIFGIALGVISAWTPVGDIDLKNFYKIINATIINAKNITVSEWFKGKFNWTSGDDWNIFDGSTLTWNETKLLGRFWFFTEESLVYGTSQGTISLTQQYDDYDSITYNLTEEVPNGLTYYANTSNDVTTDVNKICIRYKAEGDNYAVSLWSISLNNWEGYMTLTKDTIFNWICRDIRDSSDHLVDNKLLMRIIHTGSANLQHKLYIDAMYVSSGYTPRIGNEVDPNFADWLSNPIFENNINASGNITAIFINANLSWDRLFNYPVACPDGSAITQLGDAVICTSISSLETDPSWTANQSLYRTLTNNTFTNITLNEKPNACDLTINHSICSNATGTYIVG